MTEIVSCWLALQHIVAEEQDCAAHGILHAVCSKDFLFSMHVIAPAVERLASLSRILQRGDLNFVHMEDELSECKRGIVELEDAEEILQVLRERWPEYQRNSSGKIDDFTEDDVQRVKDITVAYTKAMLENLEKRFPAAHILSAFKIFNPSAIPEVYEERQSFGNEEIDLLYEKFGGALSQSLYQLKADYGSLKEQIATGKTLSTSKSLISVLKHLVKDNYYEIKCPGLVNLAAIALTLPMTTAWPERGFSSMLRIKNKLRNRLSSESLRALMFISLNGPNELSDEQAEKMTQMWLSAKKRRNVTVKENASSDCDIDG